MEITQIKIAEAAGKQDEADMLISTTMLPTQYKIPAISAMAFLTGIGTEKLRIKLSKQQRVFNNFYIQVGQLRALRI